MTVERLLHALADGRTRIYYRAGFFDAQAEQVAASRIWAGLHFRTDCAAGLALGRAVARAVLERAGDDGAA